MHKQNLIAIWCILSIILKFTDINNCILRLNFFLFSQACACVNVHALCACMQFRGQKRASGPLELELQMGVVAMWLRTEN